MATTKKTTSAKKTEVKIKRVKVIDYLNLRAGAGMEHKILGVLKPGELLVVRDAEPIKIGDDVWLPVSSDTVGDGYVLKTFVK